MRPAAVLAVLVLLGLGTASAADIAVVTHGETVDLEDHLVAGKYVLFDFYADWCGPCRQLEPYLEDIASAHEDAVAVRKVDIVNWSSPVAGQYRVRSIPHLKLFDPEGRLVAEGDAGRVLRVLDRALGGGAMPAVRSRRGPGAGMAILVVVAVAAVAVWLVGSGRRRGRSAPAAPAVSQPQAGDHVARVWYAMVQGSLVGPYTPQELAELARTPSVGPETRVRRKGDASWRQLGEVTEGP